MLRKIALVAVPLAFVLGASSASSEEVMTCSGIGALGRFVELDAKEALLGQTVTVWFFTEDSLKNGFHLPKLEPESLVRTFSASSVTESSGDQKVTDAITFEDHYWCRQDAIDGKKECFGVVVPRAVDGIEGLLEVEALPSGNFCPVTIIAKLDGALAPAGVLPAPGQSRQRVPGPNQNRQLSRGNDPQPGPRSR